MNMGGAMTIAGVVTCTMFYVIFKEDNGANQAEQEENTKTLGKSAGSLSSPALSRT
jgi:hypothetical protein